MAKELTPTGEGGDDGEVNVTPLNSGMTRRDALRITFAAAGAATVGPGLARRAGAAQATPDDTGRLVSEVPGVADAYVRVPEPYASTEGPPGKGGDVQLLTIAYNPPPVEKGDNQYWQELEKRLGVKYDVILSPQASYGEQTATIIAGGDFPDLFYVNPGQSAAHLSQAIQQGAFADLTPYLDGDARKQFPNLDRIPAKTWDNVKIGGKIYGVPKPTQLHNNLPFYRADWMRTLGMEEPGTADLFKAMVTGFAKSDPDGNGSEDTYGIMAVQSFFHTEIITEMFGSPNAWRLNEDGSLVAEFETDEYAQALEYMRGLWEAGVYHPDAPSQEWAQASDLYLAGQIGINAGGFAPHFGLTGDREQIKVLSGNPDAELLGLVPFNQAGGPGVTHNNPGYFGWTGIPSPVANDEERVMELLSIMNFMTAPFGSEESNFLSYGLEGVHHTVDADGVRVSNQDLEDQRGDLVYSLDIRESFHFYPGVPGEAEYAQDLAERALSIGVDNPVLGLVSATEQSRGSELNQLNIDNIIAIVTGRESMDALEQWRSDWRSRGGDQIRQEYQTAIQDRG